METTSFHKLQTKKTMKHHRHLRKIANLVRYAEVCVVLVLVSRLSINLPSTLKNSTEYFRNFMGSPRFVFLLGNVIIITLFAQSGHFSSHSSEKPSPEPDLQLYLEFLQNSTFNQVRFTNRKPQPCGVKGQRIEGTGFEIVKKDYRRCQSDIVEPSVAASEKPHRVLHRCDTHKVVNNNNNNNVVYSYPEDGMSNDEFRRKVEAFIARQQRLRTTELCN
ncbi:hypothetical protein VNO78_00153 [Psophocarpus tetragonolobus]|uniref:DUF4408 domain-containing protein n=1 Tax=Psophocarpus tetragonolobus TaxID=3891 RepID=A0AAN9XTY5_PSOTE